LIVIPPVDGGRAGPGRAWRGCESGSWRWVDSGWQAKSERERRGWVDGWIVMLSDVEEFVKV
jgi:hypothetical protein